MNTTELMETHQEQSGISFKENIKEEVLTLRSTVERAMTNYFRHIENQKVTDIYQMVLGEVEPPLLESVMKYVNSNQTEAAKVLGLNRGTLRKKLKQFGLL